MNGGDPVKGCALGLAVAVVVWAVVITAALLAAC